MLQKYSQDLFMLNLNHLLSGAGSTWEVMPRMFGDEWVLVQVDLLLIMISISIGRSLTVSDDGVDEDCDDESSHSHSQLS